jgi:hypothetical protein
MPWNTGYFAFAEYDGQQWSNAMQQLRRALDHQPGSFMMRGNW